jgi:hypothetical protein
MYPEPADPPMPWTRRSVPRERPAGREISIRTDASGPTRTILGSDPSAGAGQSDGTIVSR